MDDDLISRQAAIKAVDDLPNCYNGYNDAYDKAYIIGVLEELPSAQPKSTRTFVELVVEYPDSELCTYKEYKGKPYYSIKYIENDERYVGYGTYNPEVLSQYLKEYFISSAQPERKRGKWIRHPEVKNVYGGIYIECPECGEKYIVQHLEDEKFCRNCGADTREEQT